MTRSFVLSALVVGCAAMLIGANSSRVEAKPEFGTKEGVGCPACHNMQKLPATNPVGDCYKRHQHKDMAVCTKNPSK